MEKFDKSTPPPMKGAWLLAHGLCGNRRTEILSTNNHIKMHFDGQNKPIFQACS